MTTVDQALESAKVRATPEEKRSRILTGVYFALSVFVLFAFAFDEDASMDATFKLALPRDRFEPINWIFEPRIMSIVVSLILATLGVVQLLRGFGRWDNAVLGGAMVLFVLAFLGWAAAGQSFSLVGMLTSMVVLSVPVTAGGLTGLMCERVAVINIGIEGQLLGSAFVGTIVGSTAGRWVGLLGAIAIGALLGAALAVLVIKYRVDQIIAGVAINIFALGLTSFLATRVLGPNPEFNEPERFGTIAIPILEDIPVIGNMFFKNNIFLYGMLLLVVVIHIGLFEGWCCAASSVAWGQSSRSGYRGCCSESPMSTRFAAPATSAWRWCSPPWVSRSVLLPTLPIGSDRP